jgi:biofilm PGA synthesis N-glycosyltransferase PgaC
MCPAEAKNLNIEQPGNTKYVVISPVRNEAQFMEQTVQAMIHQTVKPTEWIIVNDGSTDETAEIVSRYAEPYPWLKLVHREKREDKGDRQRGKGVIDTFYFGYERLSSQDYDFIIKLDGDVSFESTYFEFLLRKFASNPKLGIAGGGLHERVDGKNWTLRSSKDHVGGPAKMYRRACFEAMGGLVPALGWDGLDEWQALALGWKVESFEELRVLHHRIMGKATGPLKSKIEMGYGAHYMGYHPLYLIARGIRHMVTWPYLVGGIAMIMAYFVAWLQGREQLPDPFVIRCIHRTQLKQLAGLLVGKRVYKS